MARWTVRLQLSALVAITAAALLAQALAGALATRKAERQLRIIERNYVPLLDLGPEIRDRYDHLRRSLQDAVSAEDKEALAATRTELAALLARTGAAPPIVEEDQIEAFRASVTRWYDLAYSVSERLIAGATSQTLVSDIRTMQADQLAVEARIQSTFVLDRGRLVTAFATVRRADAAAQRRRNLVGLILIVVVGAIALGLRRRILRSLEALSAGFARIGRGEFEEPVRVPGRDELSTLAEHANRMAGNLLALDRELHRKQDELQRANGELESFSYSVSHDLRAPLRAIDGFSKVLLDDYHAQLPAKAQDYLRRVRLAAQRMASLIDDMLRLSRVGRGPMHREPIDLSASAKEAADEILQRYPGRHVEVVIAPGLRADGDPRFLRIVLDNLLDNAVKFASRVPEPRIEVGSAERDGTTAYYVRDNGVGFDMAYASKLFGPFQRLHTAGEFPGTGIGLATVQRIVHRHGGRVWAESAEGKGATFYFTLSGPAETPPPEEHAGPEHGTV